jgi:hypothetical protein
MIEKADGDGAVWLICDDCKKVRDFSSFAKAVKFKKQQKELPVGWRTSRSASGEFHDHCPACMLKWKMGQG